MLWETNARGTRGRHWHAGSALMRLRKAGLLGLLIAALTACGSTPEDPLLDDETGAMMVANSAESASIDELNGQTVSGTIYILLEANKNVKEIHFHLNDASVPLKVDASVPYDLQLDTTLLVDGRHVLTARTPTANKKSMREVARSEFTVKNDEPVEDAGPEDPEDPAPGPDSEPKPKDELDDQPSDGGGSPEYDHLAQVYVSPSGSDSNSGSAVEPFQSFMRALGDAALNRSKGVGTRINLFPGMYRDAFITGHPAGSGPLIVIEALSPGDTVVSGADVFRDWACSGGVCSHAWSHSWGADPDPWDRGVGELARRREMVIVDGVNFDQVLSRTALVPGSFYVDEAQGRLHVMPSSLSTLDGSVVEVAVRPFLMRLQGMNDVVIKGLRFQHAASPFRRSAVEIIDQRNVVIEDSEFVWNGQNGIWFRAQDVTVRRSAMNNNGSSGVSAFKLADALFEDTEASYNNWRGFRSGYVGWEVGQKFAAAHRIVLRRHTGSHNLTRGLWFDWDAVDVLVEDSVFCDNHTNGMFIEAVQGPITLKNNIFCRNPLSGIQTSGTNRFTLANNVFDQNGHSAVNISGDFDRVVTDWETGEKHTLNNSAWLWRGNLMRGAVGARLITTSLTTSRWHDLMITSHLDYNFYEHDTQQAFQVPGGQTLDIEGWRSNTGHDANSSFSTIVASR
jgi:hypothetical protein